MEQDLPAECNTDTTIILLNKQITVMSIEMGRLENSLVRINHNWTQTELTLLWNNIQQVSKGLMKLYEFVPKLVVKNDLGEGSVLKLLMYQQMALFLLTKLHTAFMAHASVYLYNICRENANQDISVNTPSTSSGQPLHFLISYLKEGAWNLRVMVNEEYQKTEILLQDTEKLFNKPHFSKLQKEVEELSLLKCQELRDTDPCRRKVLHFLRVFMEIARKFVA